MIENKSWPVLVSFPRDLTLSSLLGILFIIAVGLMGRGMVLFGVLDDSFG